MNSEVGKLLELAIVCGKLTHAIAQADASGQTEPGSEQFVKDGVTQLERARECLLEILDRQLGNEIHDSD